MDQDVAVFEFDGHFVLIGDELRGEETAIELHTFDDFDGRFVAASFFDGDDTVLADLDERFGQDITDGRIVVPCDGGYLFDFFLALPIDGGGHFADLLVDHFDGFGDSPREGHRVGAGGDHFEPFAEDRFGQYRCGGRSVTGDIVGLAGGFFDQLGAEVLERIIQFDFFGDRYAVFGDPGGTPTFIQNRIAATGS